MHKWSKPALGKGKYLFDKARLLEEKDKVLQHIDYNETSAQKKKKINGMEW